MANIIYQTKLSGLSPILWYGQRVPDKYVAITKVVSSKVGEEYASIFTQPQITDLSYEGKSKASWLSRYISTNAVPISKLDESTKNEALSILKERILKVEDFGRKLLLSEKDENVKWGQLILKSIIFPDLNYVLYDTASKSVGIVAWGFESPEADKEFSLSFIRDGGFPTNSLISNSDEENDKAADLIDDGPKENEPEPFFDTEQSSPPYEHIENASNPIDENDEGNSNETNGSGLQRDDSSNRNRNTGGTSGIGDSGPPGGIQNGKEPFFKRFWWLWLLLLLFLLLLFLFYFFKGSSNTSQPVGDVIVPVNPEKIIKGPDSVTYIVSDRLNVALHGANKDVDAFSKAFEKKFPEPEYQIVYKNKPTARVQIEIPFEKQEEVKNRLKNEMTGFELLIWHESLFDNRKNASDPGFTDPQKSWYFEMIQTFDAWDITVGNPEVVIGIIDGGFDLNHPEISSKIVNPWNVISQSPNIYPDGQNSLHGTHVAATAAGLADNNDGVSGIAPACKIMPVKVADKNGTMTSTYVIDGFLYAVNNGADVINMSLGLMVNPSVTGLPVSEQQRIIDNSFKEEAVFWEKLFAIAEESNIPVILAGGNQNILIGVDPMIRSDYPVRVSATDNNGLKTDFSNWGVLSDVSAPGKDIYNAVNGNTFDFLSGTSMAAPMVTGAVALMKSLDDQLTAPEIKSILKQTGLTPYTSGRQSIGNIIQIKDALTFVLSGELPEDKCAGVQSKIDSLEEEIRKLRSSCENTSQLDTLQMPPELDNNTLFALGRWKSTSPLTSDVKNEPIELYFDFYADNTGRVTFLEENGTACKAAMELSTQKDEFVFDQIEVALCNAQQQYYEKYSFACKADAKGKASCVAISKVDKTNIVEFTLVKIK